MVQKKRIKIFVLPNACFFFKLQAYYGNQAKTADRKLIALFCQQKVKAKTKERTYIMALLKHEKHTF